MNKKRNKCIEALKNGYEDNFYWTQDGSNDPTYNLRIIQKGGKIILPDDINQDEDKKPSKGQIKSVKNKTQKSSQERANLPVKKL